MEGTATTTPTATAERSHLAPLQRAVLSVYIERADNHREACVTQEELRREFRRFDWESIDLARDRLIHLRHLVLITYRSIWGDRVPVYTVHQIAAPRPGGIPKPKRERRLRTGADVTEIHGAILLVYRLLADASDITAITQAELHHHIQGACSLGEMLTARNDLIDAGYLVRVGYRQRYQPRRSIQAYRVCPNDIPADRFAQSVNPILVPKAPAAAGTQTPGGVSVEKKAPLSEDRATIFYTFLGMI